MYIYIAHFLFVLYIDHICTQTYITHTHTPDHGGIVKRAQVMLTLNLHPTCTDKYLTYSINDSHMHTHLIMAAS